MKTKTTFKATLFAFLLLNLIVLRAYSADIISAKSGNWTDATTWIGGVVPTKEDNVTIAAGHTVSYFVSGTATIAVDLCKDLKVDGTLQASYSSNRLFNMLIYGAIECNGVIENGQPAPAANAAIVLKGKNAAFTGTGSANIRLINLNVDTTTCVISVPVINCSHTLQIGAKNSKIIVSQGTTITLPSTASGVLSVAQNGGQGQGVSSLEIFGTINCGKVLLCNNVTETTDKSAITVKTGGTLNVSTEFSPLRTVGDVSGTVGGSGLIFTVENGGYLNWTSPATDPRLFTNADNNPYDPKLEVHYLSGSIINGQVVSGVRTIHASEYFKDKIYYDASSKHIRLKEQMTHLSMYNCIGQLMLSKISPSSEVQLPDFLSGMYIVKLVDKFGVEGTIKINVR